MLLLEARASWLSFPGRQVVPLPKSRMLLHVCGYSVIIAPSCEKFAPTFSCGTTSISLYTSCRSILTKTHASSQVLCGSQTTKDKQKLLINYDSLAYKWRAFLALLLRWRDPLLYNMRWFWTTWKYWGPRTALLEIQLIYWQQFLLKEKPKNGRKSTSRSIIIRIWTRFLSICDSLCHF